MGKHWGSGKPPWPGNRVTWFHQGALSTRSPWSPISSSSKDRCGFEGQRAHLADRTTASCSTPHLHLPIVGESPISPTPLTHHHFQLHVFRWQNLKTNILRPKIWMTLDQFFSRQNLRLFVTDSETFFIQHFWPRISRCTHSTNLITASNYYNVPVLQSLSCWKEVNLFRESHVTLSLKS